MEITLNLGASPAEVSVLIKVVIWAHLQVQSVGVCLIAIALAVQP